MARRQHLTVILALAVTVFLTFTYLLSSASTGTGVPSVGSNGDDAAMPNLDLPSGVLGGGAIAPKLENATAKYVELLTLTNLPLLFAPTKDSNFQKANHVPATEPNSAARPGNSSTR